MKSTVALVSLLSLALAAPIPFVLVHLEAAPPTLRGHRHPDAPVSLRPAAQRPQRFPLLEDDADGAAQEEPIDNRPFTPSLSVSPSEALASPQPVATTYLLSLARLKSKPAAHDRPKTGPEDAAAVAPGSSAVQAEMGVLPVPSRRVGMPCYYMHHTQRRREYTDVLAVGLVATFLLVIVVVETWEGVVERARQYAGAQGPIHLDEEEEPDEKMPLSIQAEAIPAAELEDSRVAQRTCGQAEVER